jgi:hypothetical protein
MANYSCESSPLWLHYKIDQKKRKNALHAVMCKYYSSYMVIVYAPSSQQASKQHMEDDDVSK